MFNHAHFHRRKPEEDSYREGAAVGSKEFLPIERTFESVGEQIAWIQALAKNKLRDRLVWFGIASFASEILLVLLHSLGVIVLPNVVLYAVGAHMGGSGFGLGGLLYFIARDLFGRR